MTWWHHSGDGIIFLILTACFSPYNSLFQLPYITLGSDQLCQTYVCRENKSDGSSMFTDLTINTIMHTHMADMDANRLTDYLYQHNQCFL